jgi:tetratricopeptide (TPR) repeat protein
MKAMKTLFILFLILIFSSCSTKMDFEITKNSWIDEGVSDPIESYDEVRKEIDNFAAKLEENKSPHLNSVYIINGLHALAAKRLVEANENFQRALKFDPRSTHLHLLNALAHQLRGKAGDSEHYTLAEVGYSLAAAGDPGNSSAHFLMGIIQFKQNSFRKAQEHFAKAVQLNPNQSEYILGLAAASYYLGELGRAYANIEKARSLTPSNPEIIQASGVIYASLGAFDRANASSQALGAQSKVRQRYLQQRIQSWQNYYDQSNIKSDEKIQIYLAQKLDVFGVPEGGMFDSEDSSNEDPLSQDEQDDLSSEDNFDSSDSSGTSSSPQSESEASVVSGESDTLSDEKNSSGFTETKSKNAKMEKEKSQHINKAPKKKLKIPGMALVDVAIIRTEEIYKTSKGVNLLNGLNLFFQGTQQLLQSLGTGKMSDEPTEAVSLQLGTNGGGLNYSLNIFSNIYDRNEVIARPTILVQNKKKSSFFSGGTLHIVIEGGVAGSGTMEPLPTGVKLEVTPEFLDSETIYLNVLAERTFLEASLSQVSDSITGTSFATTTKTSVLANLTLRFGETMVISGLSDQENEIIDDKVPGLGDLPGIQYLFRNQKKTSSKKTILILLTPRRAGLSYKNGDPIGGNSNVSTHNIDELEKSASWMKPASHLKGFVRHLGKYEFFNQYRKGDMELENWAGEKTLSEAILRTIDYLYIYYNFEKSEKSEL